MDDVTKPELQVTREAYMSDPRGVLRRVSAEGPITVLDARGQPFMIVSSPEPLSDPLGDPERGR